MKDWTGNNRTTFTILGASNHSDYERAEHDFYATDCRAIDELYLAERLHRRTKDNMDKQRRVNGISLRQTN